MTTPIPSPPPDATSTKRGVVNTIAQTFAGLKTFVAGVGLGGLLTLTKATSSNRLKLSHGIEFPAGGIQDIPGITGQLTAMENDTSTVALWHLDEAVQNANAVDSSSSALDLTVRGGGPVVVDGALGKTRQFRAGSGRAYSVGPISSTLRTMFATGAYTVEFWVKPIAAGAAGQVLTVNGAQLHHHSRATRCSATSSINSSREIAWQQFSEIRHTDRHRNGRALNDFPQSRRHHARRARRKRQPRYRIYVNGALALETLNVPGLNSATIASLGGTAQNLGLGCYLDNSGAPAGIGDFDLEDFRFPTWSDLRRKFKPATTSARTRMIRTCARQAVL
jgi:hypothetical protein